MTGNHITTEVDEVFFHMNTLAQKAGQKLRVRLE